MMCPQRTESEEIMLIVRSAKRKTGTFEGKAYDNVVIFAEDNASTNQQLLFGPECKQLKIKADAFSIAFGKSSANGFSKVPDMEGAIIQPVYDEWGNMQDFTLFKPDDKGAQGK